MKSAVMTAPYTVHLEEIPVPRPPAGYALVRITLCGLCGSDVHIYHGVHPTLTYPAPMGHEIIGIVEAVAEPLPIPCEIGSRVAVHFESCGRCDMCLSGCANQCRHAPPRMSGGFAEYICVPVQNLIPLDPSLPDKAAVLTEPFACAVRSLERAQLRFGDTVLVSGGGTIGLVCAFAARLKGAARVLVSAAVPDHLDMIRNYGFEAIDLKDGPLAGQVMQLTGGNGADVIIEAANSLQSIQQAPLAAAYEGRIIMLAVGFDPPPAFEVGMIALKELSILGSRAHTTTDMRRGAQVLAQVHAAGYDLTSIIGPVFPLDKISEAFEAASKRKTTRKILIEIHQN